jgi:transcriptional regulator with XRE-family HTH domain
MSTERASRKSKREPQTGTEQEPIGAKVRRLRTEQGFAQDRLAIEAHVDQSGLSKFERGQSSRYGPLPLSRIASVLGITFEELISGTDYRKGKDSE